MKPRFTIVTPCWNARAYVFETARSVLEQTAVRDGSVELDYIVCDGGSTDGTVEALRELDCPELRVFSGRDRGMYDALCQGWQRARARTGYFAYLNAGDYYHRCAFEIVADVFGRFPHVHWLTGLETHYNARSQVIGVGLPYLFRREFFANGFHGTRLPYLQQESTFWRAELWDLVDGEQLRGLRLAGDFYLWRQFAREHELYIVKGQLGGFKRHPGQQSINLDAYHREMASVVAPATLRQKLVAGWDLLIWRYSNEGVRMRLGQGRHLVYDLSQDAWCPYPQLAAGGRWRTG